MTLASAANASAQDRNALLTDCRDVQDDRECIHNLSLIAIIADPDRYDGEWVRVRGFVHYEFESVGVYLRQDDHELSLTRNGLWLQFRDGVDPSECQDRYAFIEGRVDAAHRGHLGLWSGAIVDVWRCTAYPIDGSD